MSFNYNFLFFFFLFVVSATSRLLVDDEPLVAMHEDWMSQHGRVYKDLEEKEARFKIFKANVERINAFNKEGKRGFTVGVNKFADMTNEEFRARNTYQGQLRKPTPASESTYFEYSNLTDVPPSVDWRPKGAVTPIKDQAQCGCCWAFSAVAAIEGMHKIKTGKLISLSEQQLVDCDPKDSGCGGGLMDTAFEWIMENGGLATEAEYPYVGEDGTCKKKGTKPASQITGYKDVPANNEKALQQAVVNHPVSVALDASSWDFQFYKKGVFDGTCATNLNHAMTAVGYGTEADGTKYWLMKNSWGTGWGDKGYIKMKRDIAAKEGMCGIAMMSSYVTM